MSGGGGGGGGSSRGGGALAGVVEGLRAAETKAHLRAVSELQSGQVLAETLRAGPDDEVSALVDPLLKVLRDNNFKVCAGALECIERIVQQRYDAVYTFATGIFNAVCDKFGDAKVPVRRAAASALVALMQHMGLGAGFEKLGPKFKHRNARVRTTVLRCFMLLCDTFGEEMLVVGGVFDRVSALVNDSDGDVRKAALLALARLYPLLGDSLILKMQEKGVRPALQQQLQHRIEELQAKGFPSVADMDADGSIAAALDGSPGAAASARGAAGGGGLASTARRPEPRRLNMTGGGSPAVSGTAAPSAVASAHTSVPMTGPSRLGKTSAAPLRAPAGTGSGAAPPRLSTEFSSSTSRQPQHQQAQRQRPPMENTAPGAGYVARHGRSSSSDRGGSSGGDISPPPTNGSSSSAVSADGLEQDRIAFLGLLQDGRPPRERVVYSDRELDSEIGKIASHLRNDDDWEARNAAMLSLHGLAKGISGLVPPQSDQQENSWVIELANHMPTVQEELAAQIADLRSSVCKEACRTAAALAIYLGTHAAHLMETLTPCLLKLATVKIQVVSSAAHRAIRCIIAATPTGYPRLLAQFVDSVMHSRSSVLRTRALQYLGQALAQWTQCPIERSLEAIASAISTTVSDADADAREAARNLYWILQEREPYCTGPLYASFDSNVQRHVAQARTSAPLWLFALPVGADVRQLLASSEELPTTLDSVRARRAGGFSATTTSNGGVGGVGRSDAVVVGEDPQMESTTTATATAEESPSVGPPGHGPGASGASDGMFRGTSSTAVRSRFFNSREGSHNTHMSAQNLPPNHHLQGTAASAARVTAGAPLRMQQNGAGGRAVAADGAGMEQNDNVPLRDAQLDSILSQDTLGFGAPAGRSGQTRVSRRSRRTTLSGPVRVGLGPPATANPSGSGGPAEATSSDFGGSSSRVPQQHMEDEDGMAGIATAREPHVTLEWVIREAAGAEWATRVDVFEKVAGWLASGDADLTDAVLRRLTKLSAQHISDPNFRVSLAATQCVQIIFQQHAAHLHGSGMLGPVILRLMGKMTDPKPRMRDAVTNILALARQTYPPDVLVEETLPRLGEFSEKSRGPACDYVQDLIPQARAYLSDGAHMRTAVSKVSSVLVPFVHQGGRDAAGNGGMAGRGGAASAAAGPGSATAPPSLKSNTTTRPAVRTLEQLHHVDPELFLSQTPYLSLEQQAAVKAALVRTVPNLDAEMVRRAKQATASLKGALTRSRSRRGQSRPAFSATGSATASHATTDDATATAAAPSTGGGSEPASARSMASSVDGRAGSEASTNPAAPPNYTTISVGTDADTVPESLAGAGNGGREATQTSSPRFPLKQLAPTATGDADGAAGGPVASSDVVSPSSMLAAASADAIGTGAASSSSSASSGSSASDGVSASTAAADENSTQQWSSELAAPPASLPSMLKQQQQLQQQQQQDAAPSPNPWRELVPQLLATVTELSQQRVGAGGVDESDQFVPSLRKLVELAKLDPPKLWDDNMNQVVMVVMDAVRECANFCASLPATVGELAQQQKTVAAIRTVFGFARYQGVRLCAFMGTIVSSLLDLCGRLPGAIGMHCEEAVVCLGHTDPAGTVHALLPYVALASSSRGPSREHGGGGGDASDTPMTDEYRTTQEVCSSLRVLQGILQYLRRSEQEWQRTHSVQAGNPGAIHSPPRHAITAEEMTELVVVSAMSHIMHALSARSLDMRKAAVDCVVQMVLAAEHSVSPHLSTLSVAQQKLIAIYVHKAAASGASSSTSPAASASPRGSDRTGTAGADTDSRADKATLSLYERDYVQSMSPTRVVMQGRASSRSSLPPPHQQQHHHGQTVAAAIGVAGDEGSSYAEMHSRVSDVHNRCSPTYDDPYSDATARELAELEATSTGADAGVLRSGSDGGGGVHNTDR